jgi:hypothetical protein
MKNYEEFYKEQQIDLQSLFDKIAGNSELTFINMSTIDKKIKCYMFNSKYNNIELIEKAMEIIKTLCLISDKEKIK